MTAPWDIVKFVVIAMVALAFSAAHAQNQAPTQAEFSNNLYAVEIRIGPAWDNSKEPHEQLYFQDHSANLKRLRDQGSLVLGARYSDIGLIILNAGSEQEAHNMMKLDPSIQHHVFSYQVHEFNVFYSGQVQIRKSPPEQQK